MVCKFLIGTGDQGHAGIILQGQGTRDQGQAEIIP
jgi:hypothetical protein